MVYTNDTIIYFEILMKYIDQWRVVVHSSDPNNNLTLWKNRINRCLEMIMYEEMLNASIHEGIKSRCTVSLGYNMIAHNDWRDNCSVMFFNRKQIKAELVSRNYFLNCTVTEG